MSNAFQTVQYLFVAVLVCSGAFQIAASASTRFNGGDIARYIIMAALIFAAAMILQKRF